MSEINRSDTMKKIHQANLFILKEVDRICRKHGIQYVLDSGTLLGAIRHKGFIPWDDDADIVFLRKDYERFIEVAPKELKEGIHIWFPDKCQGGKVFYDFTPKIIYENSRKKFPDEETSFYGEDLNHICVDIFIGDEISEDPISQKLQIFFMRCIYGFAMGHRRQLDFNKYKGLQKVIVMVLSGIGKILPMPMLYCIEKKMAARQNKGKSRLIYYSNYQPDYVQITLPKRIVEHVKDCRFETERLMIPKGYDKILSLLYGDYMSLPPIEKRCATHCDLEDEGLYVEDTTV